MVVWDSTGSTGGDTSGRSIQARQVRPRRSPSDRRDPGQHLHHRRPGDPGHRHGRRRPFRGRLDERRLRRHGPVGPQHPGPAHSRQTAPPSAASSRSIPTPRATSTTPPWRSHQPAISSSSGAATARAAPTPTTASSASASRRPVSRWAASCRSTPSPRALKPSRSPPSTPPATSLVVWRSGDRLTNGPDGDQGGISAQVIGADGFFRGGEFVVNTYTTDNQYSPAVAAGPNSDFVVSWQSMGSVGDDFSAESVQAQRYEGPLFADSFESGATDAWSAAVPSGRAAPSPGPPAPAALQPRAGAGPLPVRLVACAGPPRHRPPDPRPCQTPDRRHERRPRRPDPAKGFWVRTFQPAALLIQALPSSSPAAAAGTDRVIGGEWAVRLTVESGPLADAGNLLGQLRAARTGYDQYDLEGSPAVLRRLPHHRLPPPDLAGPRRRLHRRLPSRLPLPPTRQLALRGPLRPPRPHRRHRGAQPAVHVAARRGHTGPCSKYATGLALTRPRTRSGPAHPSRGLLEAVALSHARGRHS